MLSGLIYKYSVFDNNQTFGDSLQNLKYRDEFNSTDIINVVPSTLRKIIHGLITVILPYMWEKLNRKSISDSWGSKSEFTWEKKTWRFLMRSEYYFKLLVVLNFLFFLFQGRYRNIADRLLGLRSVYVSPHMNRSVSFDFMNRELVWNSFAEMLLFLLPLINFDKIKRWVTGFGSRKLVDSENKTPFDCPICNLAICVPYVTECGHNYDFYCANNLIYQDGSFDCYKCGKSVSSLKRLGVYSV